MQYPARAVAAPPRAAPRRGGARRLWAAALALALVGCRGDTPVTTTRFTAFGTQADLSLVQVNKALAERASALVRHDIQSLERDWTVAGTGALGRVNALLPSGQPFVAPPSALPLIRLSQSLSERSGGLFNPAIGRLIGLWGFHGDATECHPPPSDRAIARLVAADPRMSQIRTAGLELQGSNPALALDFGAIAKGAAIDLAIDHLRALGIRDAQLQVGGTLRAIGDRGGQPWRIPIRRASGSGVFAVLDVRGDESVSTAAAYDRNFIYGGMTYHDIIDPRTGRPAQDAQAATVVHRDAATANAAAAALFVAGPRAWPGVARALGIRYALLVDSRGAIHLSPELRARIAPLDPKTELALSEPLDPTPAGSGARP